MRVFSQTFPRWRLPPASEKRGGGKGVLFQKRGVEKEGGRAAKFRKAHDIIIRKVEKEEKKRGSRVIIA